MAAKSHQIRPRRLSLEALENRCLLSVALDGREIYVDDVTDPEEDGSREHPFDTIQEAIDVAADGDAVVVLDGTYAGPGNRDLDYTGKAIVVRSTDPDDPAVVENTIVDCGGSESEHHRGFVFQSGEGADSVLAGLTITGGYAQYGGALFCEASGPSVLKTRLLNNRAVEQGGGVYLTQQATLTLYESTLRGNWAQGGGGIHVAGQSAAIIEGNLILSNVATELPGGGISVDSGSTARVLDNLFHLNEAKVDYGGGVACKSYALIRGNVFHDNLAELNGSALYVQSGNPAVLGNVLHVEPANCPMDPSVAQVYVAERSAPLLLNNIVWGESATVSFPSFSFSDGAQGHVFYGDTNDGYQEGSHGNIHAYPLFVDADDPLGPDGRFGTADDGFRLQSGSPGIDAGHPSFHDEDGTRSDMGAYGALLAPAVLSEIHVDGANTTGPWDGTPAHPFAHVWEALLAADPELAGPVTIHVAPGIYPENPIIDKGNVALLGAGAGQCTIDGGEAGGVLGVWFAEDVEISSLVLQGGYGYQGGGIQCESANVSVHDNVLADNEGMAGGGMFVRRGQDVSIRNNLIEGNVGRNRGGGICVVDGTSAVIHGNGIVDNGVTRYSGEGGGIYWGDAQCTGAIAGNLIAENYTSADESCGGGLAVYGEPTIARNVIRDNDAKKMGGGIYCQGGSASTIEYNVIAGNYANKRGGGIYANTNSAPLIRNNTVADNSTNNSGGGFACWRGAQPQIVNTIFWGNEASEGPQLAIQERQATVTVTYSDVQGGAADVYVHPNATLIWGEGNLDADPRFAPDENDYHLMSVAGRWDPDARDADGNDTGAWVLDGYHSPCIDRGAPDTEEPFDWLLEPVPNGGRINMGAYGGTEEAGKSSPLPHVTAMSPEPGSSVTNGVAEVVLTFDRPMEPATLWPGSFELRGAGPDAEFDTVDDVIWPMADLRWNDAESTATLVPDADWGLLPADTYRVTALDELRAAAGLRLDGEFAGTLPSGDGWEGGDFVAPFEVPNAPPVAGDDSYTVLQGGTLTTTDAAGTATPDVLNDNGVLANDGDPDEEPLTLSLTTGPDHASDFTLHPDGTFTYVHDGSGVPSDSFTYRVDDGRGGTTAATAHIRVAPQPCDLEPTALGLVDPPADLRMGRAVTIQWSGWNRSDALASTIDVTGGDWEDRVYLSADAQLDPDDTLLGTWTSEESPLAPGAAYTATLDQVTLPGHLEYSGTYYLIVHLDPGRTQAETDYENNLLATPIELQPYVEIVRPYCGRFADHHTPLGLRWHDVDEHESAELRFFVDDGAGQRWWLTPWLDEDPDGPADEFLAALPVEVVPRVEPYYVGALLHDAGGDYESDPVAVRVFERAYYSEDELGDATGGLGYETLGIEAGVLGATVYYRVLTNYPPNPNGGDLYVNVGGTWQEGSGTVHGIALNDQTHYRTPVLTPGDLYTYASFRTGAVRPDRPTFITDWVERVSGSSSVNVDSRPCLPSDYAIEGHFELGALPGFQDHSIQIAWTMYCGNDVTDVVIPGQATLQVLDMWPAPVCLCPPIYDEAGEVTVLFNQPADPASVNDSTFRVDDVGLDGRYGTDDDVSIPGSASYNPVTWRATFVPDSPFAWGHTYATWLAGTDGYEPINEDFNTAPGDWTLNGKAFHTGSRLRLSTADAWKTGSAFFNTELPAQHFVAEFDFEMHPKSGYGAGYGMAFVVQASDDGPEARGGGPGYGGIAPSLAVEFDTFKNYPHGDPNENHVGINLNGSLHSAITATGIPELEATGVFHAVIGYNRGHVTVQLEGPGTNGLRTYVDADVAGWNSPTGWFGFTGGSGEAKNNHDVDNFRLWVDRGAAGNVITDAEDNPLDGEFSCRFPSGDGVHGGDYVALFMVGENYPNVIAMAPPPDEAVAPDVGVRQLALQFDAPLERATLWAPNFELRGSGPDRAFDTPDDAIWPIEGVNWDPASYTATLSVEVDCGFLPRDLYRLTARDELQTVCGLHLDGEFYGLFPSGDGQEGGDFAAGFEIVNAPPVAFPDETSVIQDPPEPVALPPLTGCDADGDPITFQITSLPAHGTLLPGEDSAHWLYMPDAGYTGADRFQFVAYDAFDPGRNIAVSEPATFEIVIVAEACDLEPIELRVDPPVGFHMGQAITVHWTGTNHGPGSTAAFSGTDWKDQIYLSADCGLDGNDVRLHTEQVDVAPLGPDEQYSASQTVVLPPDLDYSGTYYLIVAVNTNRRQIEWDLTNNELCLEIQIDPYVELLTRYDDRVPDDLLTLYDGRFTDGHTPITVVWNDVDQQNPATISLFVEDGGGQRWWLATNIPEDDDGEYDQCSVVLPGALTPSATDDYYVGAVLTSAGAQYESNKIRIKLFERAYVTDDPLGDAIGGGEYEVHGVEAGILDALVHYRLRTDYDPQSYGGDVYLNSGGTWQSDDGAAHGIAVRDHASLPGDVEAGCLYTAARFSAGTVAPEWPIQRPYRVEEWTAQVSGSSAAEVAQRIGVDWRYEIGGYFDPLALPDVDGQAIQLAWTMSCGNDVADVTVPAAHVVARHVFYNDSKWDENPGNPGGDAAANQYDDNAIAPDKTALLPGQTATFANYTSYTKGLNGIMVDIAGLPGTPTAADFEFRMGNDDSPDAWAAAPDPSITVRPGEGIGGSDRVTLIWPNYHTVTPDPTTQAVAKQWLQVTVLDTVNTGLAEPDVFYFGNALGDSGLGNFGGRALVNAVDSGAVRDNPHNPYVNPAPLDDFADYNRDQWVNAVDFGLVRDNATNPTTALKLITAPAAGTSPGPEEAPATARVDEATLHDAAIRELDAEQEALAHVELHLPELPWIDALDLPATQGRSSKITALPHAAVEKLLATL